MIDYVGDLSRNDAEVLGRLALTASRILEFGVGASTQIFAVYGLNRVDSVDTSQEWIDKTRANIGRFIWKADVAFSLYDSFTPSGPYDLVFVDGLNELRLPFALAAWSHLRIGGALCFHDTRRTKPYGKATLSDVQMVCAVVERHSTEISSVTLNADNSNTTIIRKREPLPLEDYNALEGRTPAQLGLE